MTAELKVQSGGAADDYMPDTEEVRELYWAVSGLPRRDPKAWDEFDRWLRKEKAEAWDEGRRDGLYDGRAANYVSFADRTNPYRD